MGGWAQHILLTPEWRLFTALAIGLLVGMERERSKGTGKSRAAAGLRTFAILALLGGLSAQSGLVALVVLAGAFAAAAALLGYFLGGRDDPGLTTEVAMLATFVLGVFAQTQPVLALGAGIVITVLLAARTPLHHFVRDVLTEREVYDGLTFIIAAAVVLPMLPNRPIDPFGLFNPFQYWRLAVVLMGLGTAGHVALRMFGARYGLAIAGFASGFISSMVAIVAMAERAKAAPSVAPAAAAGAAASITGSMLFLTGLLVAADPGLIPRLVAPLACATTAIFVYTILSEWRLRAVDAGPVDAGTAFSLATVLTFAVLVGAFALLSAGLLAGFGERGVIAGAIGTGLVDAHAASVSVATLVASGKLNDAEGALAIVTAVSANMAVKIPATLVLGPRAFAWRVSAGLVIFQLALWAGYAASTRIPAGPQ